MNKTLIIAEENFECCKHIYNAIKEKQLSVEIVEISSSGEETIKMLEKFNPNILLLDLKMPNKTGLDVLNELKRKDNNKTKVIITSGEVPMVNKVNMINSDIVTNIFIKPYNYEELCSSIDLLCKESSTNNDELIDEILHCFSFNFSSIFYQYLIKCIDRSIYQSVSLKQIYKEITSDTKEKCDNIKWGVEKLIISMVKYTLIKIIREFFPYTDKPSTKIFIFTIADVVKKKIKNKN